MVGKWQRNVNLHRLDWRRFSYLEQHWSVTFGRNGNTVLRLLVRPSVVVNYHRNVAGNLCVCMRCGPFMVPGLLDVLFSCCSFYLKGM